jgi:type IV secretion system coupling TraD/TrwB family protein
MTAVFLPLGTAFLLAVLVTTLHAYELRRWRRTLLAFRLYLPHHLTADDAARWLGVIAAVTHPAGWSRFPLPPVGLEVVASQEGIAHYVLVAPALRGELLAGIQAALPGARLEEAADYLQAAARITATQEVTHTSRSRPLAQARADTVSASLLAAMQPLDPGERIILQLLMTSAGTPAPIPSQRSVGDADAAQAQRAKQREPLVAATLRVGVTAAPKRRADALVSRPLRMLQGLNAPGVRLVQRFVPSVVTAARMRARHYPLLYWPLLLNVREAAGLAVLPFGAHLPGLALGTARQLPPSPSLPAEGTVVGVSDYPGLEGRTLALSAADRLHHVHLVGPTGTGKSTLLARMALQDIASGYGVVVIDLKGDLVSDIAARIPPARSADVVLLDPAAPQTATIGLNPLRSTTGDASAQELVAEHVLTIFHALYRDFWGPRTDEILRAALFSLVYTDAPDGSAFTLIEVPELLTSTRFRQYVCAHPALPAHLRAFWQWFDGSLKSADRVQATGPVLNKLRAFSMRQNIRLLLGQSQGLLLDHVVSRNGVILLSLAKGTLGSEAAHLLGSLFVASLWHATQARITLPPERRRPIFAYLDEFQELVRLDADTSLADMLAQARGLGLSLTLAHQYVSQLPTAVRDAALGTVGTHLAFQLAWDDARILEGPFAPLARDDLAGLSAYGFALKPCVGGQTLAPVTGRALPLGEPVQDAVALARASRERYGMTRATIEAGLRARLGLGIINLPPSGRFGREATGTGGPA